MDVRNELKWTNCAPMIQGRSMHAVVVYHDHMIFAIGGKTRTECASSPVECFPVPTNTWTAVAPLNAPRRHCTAIVMGNYIYVFGGLSNDLTPVHEVERFDGTKWHIVKNMRIPAHANCGEVVYIE